MFVSQLTLLGAKDISTLIFLKNNAGVNPNIDCRAIKIKVLNFIWKLKSRIESLMFIIHAVNLDKSCLQLINEFYSTKESNILNNSSISVSVILVLSLSCKATAVNIA